MDSDPQDCALIHKLIANSRLSPVLLTNWLYIRDSYDLLPGLDSFARLTHRTQEISLLTKSVYSLNFHFITKDIKNRSQQPDEKTHTVRSQTQKFIYPWSLGPAQWHMEALFQQPGGSPNTIFVGFYGGFII